MDDVAQQLTTAPWEGRRQGRERRSVRAQKKVALLASAKPAMAETSNKYPCQSARQLRGHDGNVLLDAETSQKERRMNFTSFSLINSWTAVLFFSI
jgi:hypothetical protein